MHLKFGYPCVVIRVWEGDTLYIYKARVYDKAPASNLYNVMKSPSQSEWVDERFIYDEKTAAQVIADWVTKGKEIK